MCFATLSLFSRCSAREAVVHASSAPCLDSSRRELAMARDIMYTCAFGLRFCATHEDVFWSANIRRFFPSAFDDPLWNGILILSAWCALLIHGQAHSMQWCCSFDAWFVVDDSGYVLCRHPRQWTRHGGLQQSFLSYPPPLQDEEDDGGPDPLWAARLSPQNMCVPNNTWL